LDWKSIEVAVEAKRIRLRWDPVENANSGSHDGMGRDMD